MGILAMILAMASHSHILLVLSLLMMGCPSYGWVEQCLVCTGDNDGSGCAVNDQDQFESESCNHEDTHNMFCIAKRDKGVWERSCCQGANNCKEEHKVYQDGSTLDISVCQENDCNFMDPRQNNDPASHVSKCFYRDESGDNSDCATAENPREKPCGVADYDNEYCFVARDAAKWERGCCSGTEDDCEDTHTTNSDGSTFDKVVCRNDLCNIMDPSSSTGPTDPTTDSSSRSYSCSLLTIMASLSILRTFQKMI